MIEGVSGVLAAHARHDRPLWIPSRRRLEWPSTGAVAQIFSAEDPESLRGPQFAAAWCDELAKWRHAEATFDMLQFGLRLGERLRQVITTTPRPIALIKRLIDDPKTKLTRATTVANAMHLAPAFLGAVVDRYAGTKLGRQELDGEIVDERAGALIDDLAIQLLTAQFRAGVAIHHRAEKGRRQVHCICDGRRPRQLRFRIVDQPLDERDRPRRGRDDLPQPLAKAQPELQHIERGFGVAPLGKLIAPGGRELRPPQTLRILRREHLRHRAVV